MDISEQGLQLVERFEGGQSADGLFRAYWDPWGHVWTIGYGETAGVHPGMVWSKAQAEADLRARMVREYEPAINALGCPLDQNQYDALCSFVWNVGPGAMQWDVGRYLRQRNYAAAADALLEYDRAGGIKLAGLTARRLIERTLFLSPVPKPDPYAIFPAQAFWRRGPNERATVIAFDQARARHDRHTMRRLRPSLRQLRDRTWTVAHFSAPPSWDKFHRGARWQGLNQRMKAQ